MKAEFYFTLLDGLLATAVYHPRIPVARARTPIFWSVGLSCATGAPAGFPSTTITRIPESVNRAGGCGEERGMRTSATPVCAYCLSLHD